MPKFEVERVVEIRSKFIINTCDAITAVNIARKSTTDCIEHSLEENYVAEKMEDAE